MTKQTEALTVLDAKVYMSCTVGRILLLKSAVLVIERPVPYKTVLKMEDNISC